LAMRLTHGKNAFVVATHTDKHHIHNHILDLEIKSFKKKYAHKKVRGRM